MRNSTIAVQVTYDDIEQCLSLDIERYVLDHYGGRNYFLLAIDATAGSTTGRDGRRLYRNL